MLQYLKKWFNWSTPKPTEVADREEPIVELNSTETEVNESTGNLTINAITYDDESGQIKISMDWDDEFVNYLKRHGFVGATEEAVVHKYVATLYQNMAARQYEEGKEFE